MRKPLVGLLSGGISGERYLSLRSRENLLRVFGQSGKYRVFPIDWVEKNRWVQFDVADPDKVVAEYADLSELLHACKPDCLFDAFHGEQEIDGRLAGLLDLSGFPYVGNGFYTSFTGMDKIISKMIFEREGIPTPPWFAIEKSCFHDFRIHRRSLPLPYPLILKPKASGSSIGIKVVNDDDSFIAAMESMDDSFYPILVETFVKGRECNVGVAGPFKDSSLLVTPVTEVLFSGTFFDADIKKSGAYETRAIKLPKTLNERLIETARMIHTKFRATVITRTDFIVDVENEKINVLEINTHPGLSGCSIFPSQLEGGMEAFRRLLERLMDEKIEET